MTSNSVPLSGIIAAPFTPFEADGSLNLRPISRYAAALAADGVAGAFICGTTGEGPSLTDAERRAVTAEWCARRPKPLKVIVHVGHNSGLESVALARHAQEQGADAIATIAPSFFRPASVDDLVAWCEPIAAAAPETPFYYYHMPAMAGSDFPMTKLLPLAVERIPNFAGIKFTHENLMDYGQTLAVAAGRYPILAGRDEMLLSFLVLGATGAVGSTYNYAAPIYHRLIAAYQAGDMPAAQEWQRVARQFIATMVGAGGMGANKAMLTLATGIDCGPVRGPLRNLNPAQIAALRQELDSVGFFKNLARARQA